jgi:ankyrin repeat protein
LARLFSNHDDFKEDFELSPILSATLDEYDTVDLERPSLERIIHFAQLLTANSPHVDWASCKRRYAYRSPLFRDVIRHFHSGFKQGEPPSKTLHNLLEQPDSIQFWTPVLWASFTGREHQLITLLENGADPFYITPSRRNIFHHAGESGNNRVVSYLLNQRYHTRGVDINLPDYWLETPLHVAAAYTGYMITAYLQLGASLSARQDGGEIPLHYIRHLKGSMRLEGLNNLLAAHSRGCPEINAVNDGGLPPLFYFLDTPECVKKMLEWGADTKATDKSGKNALHHACQNNHSRSLSLLLDQVPGKVVNTRDYDGNTPLFVAFENNSVDCARMILRRAPVWEMVNGKGLSLLRHAIDMGDEVCLNLALSMPGIGGGE